MGGKQERYYGCLTKRQVEIVKAVTSGLTDKEVAAQLFISKSTVKRHLVDIYELLGFSCAGSRIKLMLWAIGKGIK